MKLLKVSRSTLAMVKAFRNIPTAVLNQDFEYFDRLSLTKEFSNVVVLAEYAVYFSYLIDYVEDDFILRALTPEVAKEAGFPNLVDENAELTEEDMLDHLVYVEDTPPEVIAAYYEDPKKWIQAFALTNFRKGTLPSFIEMTADLPRGKYNEVFYEYVFSALLSMDPSYGDWKKLFHILDDEENHDREVILLEEAILEKQAKYEKQILVAVDFALKIVDGLPLFEIHRLPDYSSELIMIIVNEVKTDLNFFEAEWENFSQSWVDSSHPQYCLI